MEHFAALSVTEVWSHFLRQVMVEEGAPLSVWMHRSPE